MNQTQLGKFIASLVPYFQPRGITRRMTVTNARPPGKATVIIGTIGDGPEAVPGQVFDIGNADAYANGEVYEIHGSGDPNDPQWRIGRRLVARNPRRGADLFAPLPIPIWHTNVNPDDGASNPICFGTEQDFDSTTGANGEPNALIRCFYRTVVPGMYSVWKEHLQNIQPQYRPAGGDANAPWRQGQLQAIQPGRPIHISTSAPVSAIDTSIPVAIPADVAARECHFGYYVHWRVEAEIVIARLALISSAYVLVVLADGRGAEGTTAAAHASGVQVELLTGQATIPHVEPGTDFAVRLAFQDGYGVNGAPGVVNVLTTWQRSSIPALTSAQFSVEMRSSGYHLVWERPTDPASGQPVTARLRYRIYRNTSATTTGAKIVEEGSMGFTADIAATLWDTPATQAGAFWFGIQPYDSFGNAGAIVWKKDDIPPPNPDPANVSVDPTANGIVITIAAIDTARDDPGWKEYVLYGASDQLGTGAVERARFSPNMVTLQVEPDAMSTAYQVVSADWAGNVGALSAGAVYWKYVPALYWTDRIPMNGNFQLGNENNDFARYWEVITGTFAGYAMNTGVTWSTSGGISGNKSIVLTYAGSGSRNFGIRSTVAVPLNAYKDAFASLWAKIHGGDGRTLSVDYRFECYSDDAGTVLLGTYGLFEQDIVSPVNDTWYQFTPKNLGKLKDVFATARTVKVSGVIFYSSSGGAPPAQTITIDDFLVTQ